jgi:hypothetical protein
MRRSPATLALATALGVLWTAGPAEARFGKAGSPSGSKGGSLSGGGRAPASSSGTSAGSYHAAAPVGAGAGPRGWSFFSVGARPWHSGFYSGAFVPWYGYRACVRATPLLVPGPSAVSATSGPEQVEDEAPGLRVSGGIEVLYLTAGETGFVYGGGASFEGERWGLTLQGQNIAVRADDGTNTVDNLGVLTARLSFAFLTGKYGRLRVEAGADTVVAPNLVAVGPVAGVSGTLWLSGPFALEASAFVVPWPYRELDWRAGVVVGLGAVGLRVGWRTQVLDDRGWVDGVIRRDAFMGPYAGLAVTF